MDDALVITPDEARVLGCLIEKNYTTPAYYPLTLNALTTACNQKQNRHPLMALSEDDVVRALDGLREHHLATRVYKAESRVPKYEHRAPEALGLGQAEASILCELLLRGPQTGAELRSRAERMCHFGGRDDAEEALTGLMNRPVPLIVLLPRQTGQKEQRYAHLMCGEPEIPEPEAVIEPARERVRHGDERISALEQRVEVLEEELRGLKDTLETFRQQFE